MRFSANSIPIKNKEKTVLTTNPNILIYVIIIIICLQFIESNFLTPKIQENFLQINPILVVFSVTFFGKVLGIFGMIIAVPIIRVIQIVVNVKKIDKKKMKRKIKN